MKTLFVNPDASVYRHIPPLALAYVATIKKIKVVDQNTKPEPRDRFLQKRADTLGVFVRSISFSESKRIAKIYQKRYKKAEIKSIWTPIDVQCCYPTIQFKNQIKLTKPFGDNYPFPDFSLFDSLDVFVSNWQKDVWPYGILTSVGCPFQCTYCAARNRGWRPRSPENCAEELRQAKKKYGITSFEILDDAFNIDKRRVLKFCKLVKPLNLRWICANGLRADLFDEEQAKAMSQAGCSSVSFGIEAVDNKVLKKVNKGETLEQIEKAVKIANFYFKKVNGFFIIGLPGSSYKKDLGSVSWMIRNRISGVFSYFVPMDKKVEDGNLFYGKEARPQSCEYDWRRQKEIYEMTKFMTTPTTLVNFLPKAFALLSLVYQFDRNNFFKTTFAYFKKVL